LTKQRYEGHEEQAQPAAVRFTLCDLEGGGGFACSASHNQLAVVSLLEPPMGILHSGSSMLEHALFWHSRMVARDAFVQALPVDRRFFQDGKAYSFHRRVLAADRVFCLAIPFIGISAGEV
jgi:hypothetical protein